MTQNGDGRIVTLVSSTAGTEACWKRRHEGNRHRQRSPAHGSRLVISPRSCVAGAAVPGGGAVEEAWRRKGATLSDKTARKEFGLTQDEIEAAIEAGQVQ